MREYTEVQQELDKLTEEQQEYMKEGNRPAAEELEPRINELMVELDEIGG